MHMSWWTRGKSALLYEDKIITKKEKLIFIIIDLCNRSNTLQNVCQNTTKKLFACLEDDSYGTSYVCLCMNGGGVPVATTDADCG